MTCSSQYVPQLHSRGFRVTSQRMAILHVLRHSQTHLSPSEVYELARREQPGYAMNNGKPEFDPWIRLDGQALFRTATESFTAIIRDALAKTGWTAEETRWIIPHQANGRILKAAAKRSGVGFERFYMNVERVGNTSSASIPLAIVEADEVLQPGDKLVLCSVGAGMTTAAIAVEW